MTRNLDFLGDAEGSLFEREFEVVSEVRSALNTCAAASAAEEITEPEDIAQNVAEIGEDVRIETTRARCPAYTCMAEPVVVCPLLSITQNRVCFGRLFE